MDLQQLQKLAGITEGLQQHSYTFYIIDPKTAEFTQYFQGSVGEIIKRISADRENSQIADVIRQQRGLTPQPGGIISFPYDDHLYAFIPN